MKNDKYIDTNFNLVVGNVLKKKREEKNISLEELSAKINFKVKRQALFYYETGRSKIKVNTFIDICNALNLNPNDIFDEINIKYIKNATLDNEESLAKAN